MPKPPRPVQCASERSLQEIAKLLKVFRLRIDQHHGGRIRGIPLRSDGYAVSLQINDAGEAMIGSSIADI